MRIEAAVVRAETNSITAARKNKAVRKSKHEGYSKSINRNRQRNYNVCASISACLYSIRNSRFTLRAYALIIEAVSLSL